MRVKTEYIMLVAEVNERIITTRRNKDLFVHMHIHNTLYIYMHTHNIHIHKNCHVLKIQP